MIKIDQVLSPAVRASHDLRRTGASRRLRCSCGRGLRRLLLALAIQTGLIDGPAAVQ
ncbi:hypothetical protein [Methylobacterium trifolii]|uniref:hypothetical protein n=1 Tax=Methylobacterium trifolii TaxID=1003092 RepID=UPI001EE0C4E0|nr:hypothetical protein [Methylobacterium trifolii]